MKKHGFTLVELLAVIAIMGILSVMITPAIINIRNDILERTRNSRESLIKTAALDWAADNIEQVPSNVSQNYDGSQTSCNSDCACILIGELINRGYLSGSDDNGNTITNPVTSENLNGKLVCVRYDTNIVLPRNTNERERKLMAYIVE